MPELPDQKQLPAKLKFWEGSSVHVNQGRHWSSAIIWLSTSLFGATLLWAFTAKIDQSVAVSGRLEPSGSVREVDSPSGGVIGEVFVKEGALVQAGQPLFTVEGKGLASRRQSLIDAQRLLKLQASSLKSVLVSEGDPSRFAPEPSLPNVDDPQIRAQLGTARQQSQQLRAQFVQISAQLVSRRKTLALQELIARDLKPLYESGAMARNQYLSQLNQVQETRSQVASLDEERSRVIGQAAAQLNQVDRQLINLNAELVGVGESINYRTVKAPIDGRVFNSEVSPYSVINANQVVLKLVPENLLEAKVSISNSDIGFVSIGMPVAVSVNSFPAGEFGYIDGTLSSIGLDVLKPDQENPAYRFPAQISLKQQTVLSGDNELNLQSGMSVTASIKLRSRPVISILSDLFVKQLDGLKRFR
jgi:HlyD family secretion protein